MTWDDKPFAEEPFLGPDVSAYMTDDPDVTYTMDDSSFVECDAPGCGLTWDVIGKADLPTKDEYLRTQGWSAVPNPQGEMEHLCLEHA